MKPPSGNSTVRRALRTTPSVRVCCELPKRAELADFIVGYKTNPHRDHYETGYHSMQIPIDSVFGRIFSWKDKMEKNDAVLALSSFMDPGVWNADLLVVKDLFPARYRFLLQNRGQQALTYMSFPRL